MHVIIGLVDDDNREQLICMVRDPKDRAEIEQHVANHNVEGMRQALGYRRATLIPNRTHALLLEQGPELCKVRLISGEVRGREGWLPHEYLLREAR